VNSGFISFGYTIYAKEELLSYLVILFLSSLGTSTLFSMMATPIDIPTKSVQCFPFSIPLPTLVIYPNECEMISQNGFDLHFSSDL
jgi:ABC-type uncharacterized transport system permease subunit